MNYPSPRTPGSTPGRDWEYSRMSSATPTPSPRHAWFETATPRRPSTRAAHGRTQSYSQPQPQPQPSAFSPRPPRDSPRYNSYGEYATVDVSPKHSSSRTQPQQQQQHRSSKSDHRRYSFTSHVRASTPYGESDEDEIIEAMGRTFVLPSQARSKGRRRSSLHHHQPDYHEYYDVYEYDGAWYTNHHGYQQSSTTPLYPEPGYSSREASYDPPPPPLSRPIPQTRPPTSFAHTRRSSTSMPVPPRPSTARPTATSSSTRVKQPSAPKATEYDARRYKIPAGYSLKHWDPAEEPILLLGSVFDANSLGKWIYDWTVYREGPGTPISDMSGELWLLLIQFSGKVRRAENIVGTVRSVEKRETINDFIDAGERIMEKLRSLLKSSEAPMLKAARKSKTGLGKNSGVEFVDTLFGRDRELSKTEKFMQSVRLFNLRFDANCEEILQEPTL